MTCGGFASPLLPADINEAEVSQSHQHFSSVCLYKRDQMRLTTSTGTCSESKLFVTFPGASRIMLVMTAWHMVEIEALVQSLAILS